LGQSAIEGIRWPSAAPNLTKLLDDAIDWLGLWALSLSFCAVVLASIAYFLGGDNIGASFILVAAAASP
jgi:hypothetical protein